MNLPVIDTHCHLDAVDFDADREAVVLAARAAGLLAQIVPALHLSQFSAVARLSTEFNDVSLAFGFHPLFLSHFQARHMDELREWLKKPGVVAIGECGIDYHRAKADKGLQKSVFKAQLALACEYNLPVIVHANKAVEDVIICVREFPDCRGVVHSFNGSEQQAQRLIEQGWMLGFGGAITHPGATRLRQLVSGLPGECLLLETDAPYQSPAAAKGCRNEPRFIVQALQSLAELQQCSEQKMASLTLENAYRLFGHGIEPGGKPVGE